MTDLKIGFVSIIRSTFDTVLAAEVTARAYRHLSQAGLILKGPEEPIGDGDMAHTAATALREEPLDLLILLQATFADATIALALAEATAAPILFWALPEAPSGGRLRLNSLCGVNLGIFSLRQAGLHPYYCYAEADDESVLAKVETLARAGRALRLLRQARVGVIGQHPDGFGPCQYDAEGLATLLGVTVVPFELQTFFARVRQIKAQPAERAEKHKTRLAEQLTNLSTLDQKGVQGTLCTFEALNDLAQTEKLKGIAVRCWPEFFTDLGCAACGALSLLTDAGVPCSCEADVNGTVTQLLLQAMGNEPTFITDLVSADPTVDTLVFWHCGLAPLSMADPAVAPQGTIHSNRQLPLLMEFPLKPGRVTVARLSESKDVGYRLVVGRGEMLARPKSFSGTSGVCRFDRPAEAVLGVIMAEGLEHHYSIIYGDYYDSLLALAEMLDLPVVRLTD